MGKRNRPAAQPREPRRPAAGRLSEDLIVGLRRAAIQQVKACDRALGWQTEIKRVKQDNENETS